LVNLQIPQLPLGNFHIAQEGKKKRKPQKKKPRASTIRLPRTAGQPVRGSSKESRREKSSRGVISNAVIGKPSLVTPLVRGEKTTRLFRGRSLGKNQRLKGGGSFFGWERRTEKKPRGGISSRLQITKAPEQSKKKTPINGGCL